MATLGSSVVVKCTGIIASNPLKEPKVRDVHPLTVCCQEVGGTKHEIKASESLLVVKSTNIFWISKRRIVGFGVSITTVINTSIFVV